MKISIASKLVLFLTIILISVFLLQSFILIQREIATGRENIIANAKSFSSLSAGDVIKNYNIYYESGFYKFSEIVQDLFSKNSDLERMRILNQNGEILFESEEIFTGKYQAKNSKIRLADGRELQKIRDLNQSFEIVTTNNKKMIEVMNPYVEEWGGHYFTVEYYFSFTSLDTKIRQIIINLVVWTAPVFLLLIFIIFFFSNKIIVRPLKKIATAANSFSQGALDHEVKVKSGDEIGELADNFNKMFRDLKKSRSVLEDYAKNLEIKIKERTKELEKKNLEQEEANANLEQANKMMIGRELRMIELKKEIEELKKKISEK